MEEIYSLLIPLAGDKLLVPRLTVAEIMGYGKPEPFTGAPAWLLGTTTWENRPIPLLSFEGICGKAIPERGSRTRVTALFALGGRLDPPVFAFVTQGYPYLVRVNPTLLSADTSAPIEAGVPALSRVRLANERPIIPDLEAIETRLVEAMEKSKG